MIALLIILLVIFAGAWLQLISGLLSLGDGIALVCIIIAMILSLVRKDKRGTLLGVAGVVLGGMLIYASGKTLPIPHLKHFYLRWQSLVLMVIAIVLSGITAYIISEESTSEFEEVLSIGVVIVAVGTLIIRLVMWGLAALGNYLAELIMKAFS